MWKFHNLEFTCDILVFKLLWSFFKNYFGIFDAFFGGWLMNARTIEILLVKWNGMEVIFKKQILSFFGQKKNCEFFGYLFFLKRKFD
jgi:hypothetical protein